ncbi:MAG: glycosyltransferase family 2 protein [Candidatus Andersenbacteria bacterium]
MRKNNHSPLNQALLPNNYPTKPLQKLVVIIPALNEAVTISAVINGIPHTIQGISTIEVVVIDDGSVDQTSTLARTAGAEVIRHKRNLGLGAAFRTGINEALRRGADIIVNMDSDGQFDPRDIPRLITLIQNGMADFVTTTRFAKPEYLPDMPAIKLFGNRWMTRIVNFLTAKKFTDVSCGFRAYSREAALKLTLFGRFTYTQETFIDLAYKDISMAEVPLRVRGQRQHGRSRIAGSLWRYGIKSASIIFRAARDYQPLYFFGIPGVLIFFCGIIAGIFLVIHYVQTGQTHPYRSLVQISGILIIVGFLLLFISLLADMLHRNRVLMDESLYYNRKKAFDRHE